jgi:hypothetical protein
MKKTALFSLLALALIGSCKKDDEPGTPIIDNPTPIDTIKYSITGLHDLSMQPTDTIELPVQVNYISGARSLVTLSAGTLPPNINISFEPIGDTPNYNSVIRLYSDKAIMGNYTLSIKGNSVGGSKNNLITLTVRQYDNDAKTLEGQYTETGNCVALGSVSHPTTITADAQTTQRVNLQGLWTGALSMNVYADLNKTSKTLIIPSQISSGIAFEGTGTYTDTSMSIHYKAFNDTCTTVLTRQ